MIWEGYGRDDGRDMGEIKGEMNFRRSLCIEPTEKVGDFEKGLQILTLL